MLVSIEFGSGALGQLQEVPFQLLEIEHGQAQALFVQQGVHGCHHRLVGGGRIKHQQVEKIDAVLKVLEEVFGPQELGEPQIRAILGHRRQLVHVVAGIPVVAGDVRAGIAVRNLAGVFDGRHAQVAVFDRIGACAPGS